MRFEVQDADQVFRSECAASPIRDNVCMMAIDGTGRRDCMLNEVSENDAVLTVERSIHGLNIKEFFLRLSSAGLAYHRCGLVRVNGTKIDVEFLRGQEKGKQTERLVELGWPSVSPECTTSKHFDPTKKRLLISESELRALLRAKHSKHTWPSETITSPSR